MVVVVLSHLTISQIDENKFQGNNSNSNVHITNAKFRNFQNDVIPDCSNSIVVDLWLSSMVH